MAFIGKNIETGEVLRFESVTEAKQEKFRPTEIRDVCYGLRKQYKGFTWEMDPKPDNFNTLKNRRAKKYYKVRRRQKKRMAPKSFIRFCTYRWNSINERTINGQCPNWTNPNTRRYLEKGIRVEMTRGEFFAWCETHRRKIMRLYREEKTPSVDRIDPKGPYHPDNMRIIDNDENLRLARSTIRKNFTKPVIGKNPNTGETLSFSNFYEIPRGKINRFEVYRCCIGSRETYRDMQWCFAT